MVLEERYSQCCVCYCDYNVPVSGLCENYGLGGSNDIHNASCTTVAKMLVVVEQHDDRPFCPVTAKGSPDKLFKLRYVDTLLSFRCKERDASKFQLANGRDECETTQEEWEDNIDLWPSITYVTVYVCMFMILHQSPYTKDDICLTTKP